MTQLVTQFVILSTFLYLILNIIMCFLYNSFTSLIQWFIFLTPIWRNFPVDAFLRWFLRALEGVGGDEHNEIMIFLFFLSASSSSSLF